MEVLDKVGAVLIEAGPLAAFNGVVICLFFLYQALVGSHLTWNVYKLDRGIKPAHDWAMEKIYLLFEQICCPGGPTS